MPRKKTSSKSSREGTSRESNCSESLPEDAALAGMDFETATARLEAIVEKLETGEAPLNESLQEYEQGVRLLRHCHRLLTGTERKVEQLRAWNDDGNPVLDSIDPEDFRSDATRPGRARRRDESP